MKAVARVTDRMRNRRAVHAGAVALGLCAVALGLGAGIWAAAPLLLLATVRRPPATHAAARLDAHLDQDGAVRTAWDHRADPSPMAVAQRRRIEARLTDDHIRAAAPAAHPAWLLSLGLFAWPVLQTPAIDPANLPSVASVGSQAAGAPPSAKAPGTDALGPTPASAASKASARSTAPRSTPPAGVPSDGAGQGGATAKIAGVGAHAGDRLALPVAAERVGLSPGTAAGLWLSDASGAPLPDPPLRVALAPPGGSPDDDITDPARPYPRRYHTLIARWFAR